MGIPSELTLPPYYYSYIGNVHRVISFTHTPSFLISILSISILFSLRTSFISKQSFLSKLILITLFLCSFLTLSKSLLLLTIGILYLYSRIDSSKIEPYQNKLLGNILMVILFIVVNFGTHLLVINKSTVDWDIIESHAVNEPIFEINQSHQIVPTPYLSLKKASLYTGIEYFPMGIGAGQARLNLVNLKKLKIYPKSFLAYDPHSTYFGAFAEIGVLGLLSILFLAYALLQSLRQLKKEVSIPYSLTLTLQAICLMIVIEAIYVDIMNFRHYWVLIAIIGVLSRSPD